MRAEDCCDPRSDGSQYAAAAHQTTPSPVGEGWGGVRPLCHRCQNDRRTAPSPCGGRPGRDSPALPPMPKPPPNSSFPLWGKSRAGFARFATDAKATAERRSRRGKGQGGIRPLCRRCQNDRRTAPSPVGKGWSGGSKPSASATASKTLFKILAIHTNLNCYAEYPPPLQGAQRPQRGRVGEGVSDIIDEPKFQ